MDRTVRIALEDIKTKAKGREENYLQAVAFSMLFKSIHNSSILLSDSVSVRKNRKALLSRLGVGEKKFSQCLSFCRMYGLLVPVDEKREKFVPLYKKRERLSKIQLERQGKKVTVNYVVHLLRSAIALDHIRFVELLKDSDTLLNSDARAVSPRKLERARKIINRFADGEVRETISVRAFSKKIGASKYKTRKALNHILEKGYAEKEAVLLNPRRINKCEGFREIMNATEADMERDYLRGNIIHGQHGKKAYGVFKDGYIVYQTSNKWTLTELGRKQGKFITGKKAKAKKTSMDGSSETPFLAISGEEKFGMFH